MIKIDSTRFGSITINGKKYNHDVTVNYRGKIEKGWLQTRHLIDEKEFFDFLKENPEIIVIGNGQYGACGVSNTFKKLAEERGIGVIVSKTPEAIEKFNELVKTKSVVAYFHVTC